MTTTSLAPRSHPIDSPLDGALLCDIAGGLAAAPALWSPHVGHDESARRSVRLVATDRWEAWLICWTSGQQVDWHDHGGSVGAIATVEGELLEATPGPDGVTWRVLEAGSTVAVPPGTVHDVVGGVGRSVSIHVYSPPLTTMTFFDDDLADPYVTAVADETPVTDLRTVARALHPAAGARS